MNFPENKKIILFDGVCNLCNAWVNFIIKHDKKKAFLFTSIQSNSGKNIINLLAIDISKTDSIILFEPEIGFLIRSKAIFKIAKTLGGFFIIITFFSFLPKKITDYVYQFIAKNRYKWFGKKDYCMMPNQEIVKRFLE